MSSYSKKEKEVDNLFTARRRARGSHMFRMLDFEINQAQHIYINLVILTAVYFVITCSTKEDEKISQKEPRVGM